VIFAPPPFPVTYGAYLGWNDEGSWIVDTMYSGKVYVWNRKANALTLRYGRDIDIPRHVIATLRNYSGLTAYWVDPNLPGLLNDTDGLKVSWDKRFGRGAPIVTIRGYAEFGSTTYLGWNDRGSWLAASKDGHVYIWNFKHNALTLAYMELKAVPRGVLASLRDRYGRGVTVTPPGPVPKGRLGPHPVTPDASRQQASFGDSAALRNSLSSFQGGATSSNAPSLPGIGPGGGKITGRGATVIGRVLTFADAGGGRRTYKVVRPKVAMGPQGTGNTGVWLAIEDRMMFTLQGDGTVVGQKAPPVLFQMLMQQPH
jgi:hypothetical protein